MTRAVLQVRGASKRFGAVRAVDDVDLDVLGGEIVGVVGPNGAGKTTLFDLIAGSIALDSGTIHAWDRSIGSMPAYRRARLGIARTFQTTQAFPNLSVLENLLIAGVATGGFARRWLGRYTSPAAVDNARQLAAEFGVGQRESSVSGALSQLELQRLSLAMAVATGARILLVDEPSGGLTQREVDEIGETLDSLRERRMSVVIIDHKMRLVLGVCNRVMVMNTGRPVMTGTPAEVEAHDVVRSAYLGQGAVSRRETVATYRAPSPHQRREPLIECESLELRYGKKLAVESLSLTVPVGSCVALVGTNGAGKTTALRALSGLHPVSGGLIRANGQPVADWNSTRAVAHGIVHCPEGRHLFPAMTVVENLLLGIRGSGGTRRDVEERLAHIYEVFPDLPALGARLAGTLSGGQQQMVALGRALISRPQLLILDEPSLGLAPVLVQHMFETVSGLISSDLSVLISEQNVEAAIGIADYVYVLTAGRLAFEGTPSRIRADKALWNSLLGT